MSKHVAALFTLFLSLSISAFGQTEKNKLPELCAKTLQFFERIEEQDFNAYLKRVRLPQASTELKAEALRQLAKVETVSLSEKMQAKLSALRPIFQHHEREAVIEIKIITARQIFVGLQGRAVLLLSDTALLWLTTEELQAVVAHEMGHEYFWRALMEARQQKNYEMMREIEMRADGIAVITLHHLGLDPAKLISGIMKVRSINNLQPVSRETFPYPMPDERAKFIRAMSELVQARAAAKAVLAQK